MGKLILVLGGARSGKSTHAETLAQKSGGDSVLYVATAEARDEEMRTRIKQHQQERPETWLTLESPLNVGQNIQDSWNNQIVILIDCLTLLVSNILLACPDQDNISENHAVIQDAVLQEMEDLIKFLDKTNTTIIVVSNEVGLGLVPPYELGRTYRDILGRTNQYIAKYADEVLLMVAGIPLQIK